MSDRKTYFADDLLADEIEFNECTFSGYDFLKADFNSFEFHECVFENCNCSLMNVNGCVLDNVVFTNCKLSGTNFTNINKFLFSVNFAECNLDYVIFEKNNLKLTVFNACSIIEASFIETNLFSSRFADCNLRGTLFERCILEKTDFTSAQNYFIDLDKNKVKGACFSMPEVMNLLMKYEIKIK